MINRVLVGDVGGTNVRFGVASRRGNTLAVDDFAKFAGDDFELFDDALLQYVTDTHLDVSKLSAVFALAGPPVNGTVTLTNRDWTISAGDLQKKFGLSTVRLANDFAAMARSVPELNPTDFLEIKHGFAKPNAPIVIAGPGTGFGVATLMHLPDNRWHIISGEGGYMAYAPQTDIEYELAKRLQAAHGYVFTELVCAGIGLEPVHRALCEIFERDYQDIPPGEMLKLASEGDAMFTELCRIRARGTMRAVGDLVLANGALGGAILAGGVSERLIDYLREPVAHASFTERGKNTPYLQNCPIHLIRDPVAPLIGAAAFHLMDQA